jgi:hypothetical protein
VTGDPTVAQRTSGAQVAPRNAALQPEPTSYHALASAPSPQPSVQLVLGVSHKARVGDHLVSEMYKVDEPTSAAAHFVIRNRRGLRCDEHGAECAGTLAVTQALLDEARMVAPEVDRAH